MNNELHNIAWLKYLFLIPHYSNKRHSGFHWSLHVSGAPSPHVSWVGSGLPWIQAFRCLTALEKNRFFSKAVRQNLERAESLGSRLECEHKTTQCSAEGRGTRLGCNYWTLCIKSLWTPLVTSVHLMRPGIGQNVINLLSGWLCITSRPSSVQEISLIMDCMSTHHLDISKLASASWQLHAQPVRTSRGLVNKVKFLGLIPRKG